MFDLLQLGGMGTEIKNATPWTCHSGPQVTTSKTPTGYLPAAFNIEYLLFVVKLWFGNLRKFYIKENSLAA